jgi:hypothetical protein
MRTVITINENGYLTSICTGPGVSIEGGIEIEINDNDLDFVIDNLESFIYSNNELILDDSKKSEMDLKNKISSLQNKRVDECFSIINRGALWYETLDEDQKAELRIWYKSWLDVTETLTIPEKPEWLK